MFYALILEIYGLLMVLVVFLPIKDLLMKPVMYLHKFVRLQLIFLMYGLI
ncbi:unnamed protein product [Trichobilharzia regenti]|nr:unnamed protein product [Trichobilharzia regenti]